MKYFKSVFQNALLPSFFKKSILIVDSIYRKKQNPSKKISCVNTFRDENIAFEFPATEVCVCGWVFFDLFKAISALKPYWKWEKTHDFFYIFIETFYECIFVTCHSDIFDIDYRLFCLFLESSTSSGILLYHLFAISSNSMPLLLRFLLFVFYYLSLSAYLYAASNDV